MNEDDFQMMAMQMAVNADTGDSSHMRGSPPKRIQTSLMTPYSVWKNHAQISPANASGSAHGNSSASRTGHCRLNGRLASNARPRPTSSAPGTVTTVISTVFQVASQKAPSLDHVGIVCQPTHFEPRPPDRRMSKKLL